MRSFLVFSLGVIVGALLLFGLERLPSVERPFISPEQAMGRSVSGYWKGNVDVSGYNVDFALLVKTDGKTLSGVLTSSRVGDLPCDQIQVDDRGNITFSTHFAGKDASFTGKVAPDHHSMTGSLTGSVGDGSWSLAKGA
jgi:hypothetical protein